METAQKPEFLKMLAKLMGSYGKPLPEAGLLAAWWDDLSRFPLPVVVMAFSQYRDENGEFAPVPAGIAKRCNLLDGRPGEEEAWANVLTSRDEAATVVWTKEAAEAFAIARPTLEAGDEVGARMAFKEAYRRMVAAARAVMESAQWTVSLGWDVASRKEVIRKATTAGLLAAPAVVGLLPPPDEEADPDDEAAQRGLKTLKDELAKLSLASNKKAEQRAAELQAERDAVAARKRELDEQAATYQQEHSSKVSES